jgi:hypothetical protein
MKNVLIFLAGAAVLFIVLRIIKGKVTTSSTSSESQIPTYLAKVAKTSQAKAVVKSTEFKALIKTTEFQNLVSVVGAEEISTYLL